MDCTRRRKGSDLAEQGPLEASGKSYPLNGKIRWQETRSENRSFFVRNHYSRDAPTAASTAKSRRVADFHDGGNRSTRTAALPAEVRSSLERHRGWRGMKIILSRKGFDSSAGGVPSPIFPDGKMLSLPIPDESSTIAYRDIAGNGWASVGELVNQLAHIPATHGAHLDPDLSVGSIPRVEGWRPLFGQAGAAESHLENQGVGTGDVFLFFGLFQAVEKSAAGWQVIRGSRPMHVIFGWLQIAERVAISDWPSDAVWALYHPHFRRESQSKNVLYVATERLSLPGIDSPISIDGGGLSTCFSPRLRLTGHDFPGPSRWLLPGWFHPGTRGSVLSYHGDPSRWGVPKAGVTLRSVSKGQEFVLDCDKFPEAIKWSYELLLSMALCGQVAG